jgi:hypothetical protein
MQFGLTGMATLSWPSLLKLRAANAALPKSERKSIIMVWLPGGQSHIDTYDPKPDASSEYRGPFKTISTKVPGTHFTELLPMNAKIADKFTVLRSMNQTAGRALPACERRRAHQSASELYRRASGVG